MNFIHVQRAHQVSATVVALIYKAAPSIVDAVEILVWASRPVKAENADVQQAFNCARGNV